MIILKYHWNYTITRYTQKDFLSIILVLQKREPEQHPFVSKVQSFKGTQR